MPSSSPTALRRVWDATLDVLIVVAALLGAALAASGSTWGGLCVIGALVAISAQLVDMRLAAPGPWSPLGRSLVLRSVAAAASAVCVARSTTGTADLLAAALGAAVLTGSIAVEPFVARAARFSPPLTARLPGVPTRRGLPDLGVPAVLLSVLATGLGPTIGVAGLSPWWWVATSLLAMLPVLLLAADGRAKIVFARRLRAELPKAVAAYAPDFLVYTSRPDDASYQVLMWLPYLERAGLRFLIVTRNAVPAEALAARTEAPVVEARGIADLDALVVPSLKAAFYVNASSGNGSLVRFQHLTHIYLGHGDSDKPPSYNPTHAMYDVIFAAGPAATRRYADHGVRIPAEKFRVVGRPQVEDVRQAERPVTEVAAPTVLYAPTWRGHVEETMLSSLPVGERIVSALLARGARVIFRPHPFSYEFPDDAAVIGRIHRLLEADRRQTGREHLWGPAAEHERGILDCINDSDAMVSDVSSVVSDYLFSGKPFAMIAVPAEPGPFVEQFPVARGSYVVRGDLADLDAQLDTMLSADPMAARRREIRADYLGDFPAEDYASAFVDAVRAVTGKAMPDLDSDADGETGGDAEIGDEGIGREGAGAEQDRESAEEGTEPAGDRAAVTSGGRNWSRYVELALRAGLDLLGTALALGALAVALVHGPGWALAVLTAASLWATAQSAWPNLAARDRWPRLLTEGDVTRAVLVIATVVARDADGISVPELLTAALLLAVIAVERRIRPAWTGGLLVRHLPGVHTADVERVPRGLVPILGALVVLAGAICAWLGSPDWLPLLLAAALAALTLVVLARAIRRASAAMAAEERLRPALQAYGPQFVVYFASTVGAGYQVGMWLDYFVRIGRPFVVLTRTAAMHRQVEQLCADAGVQAPLVHRPTLRSVEEAVVDSMTTAFYVNNAPRNTHLVERRELTHVWLNHGDSEKPACYNPVHAIYDLIFSAGQAGVDRYARHGVHIPAEKFRIVGRPQVERIGPPRGPIADLADRTVLYAPTWQGPFADSRVYSLPSGREIVQHLLDRQARVIFRAHPFNYRYPEARQMIADVGALLEEDRARTGRGHLWGPAAEQQLSVEDCFNASDAMVSDVSAVVSDYLHSGKPFAMVAVGRAPEQLVRDAPAATAAYVIRDDLTNLDEVCDLLLGPDPLRAERERTKIYYLGDFPDENYAEGFLAAAREVIDAGRRR